MTDETTAPVTINNGCRPNVSLPEFEGVAGFVQRSERSAHLAYVPSKVAGSPVIGIKLAIEGTDGVTRTWKITDRENSPYVGNMVVLTLELEA